MIEIEERREGGLQRVRNHSDEENKSRVLGDVVKTATNEWLALPLHYRNLPPSVYARRRDAVDALVSPTGRKYSLRGK